MKKYPTLRYFQLLFIEFIILTCADANECANQSIDCCDCTYNLLAVREPPNLRNRKVECADRRKNT
nr:MAG TPA: hypothetical protein [Caudoviricetes sp.]